MLCVFYWNVLLYLLSALVSEWNIALIAFRLPFWLPGFIKCVRTNYCMQKQDEFLFRCFLNFWVLVVYGLMMDIAALWQYVSESPAALWQEKSTFPVLIMGAY